MSNSEIFLDGLKITVLGMGWVFLFLVVMIQIMKLLSVLLAPFTKREMEAAATEKAKRAVQAPVGSSDDAELAAVAAVAVARSLAK